MEWTNRLNPAGRVRTTWIQRASIPTEGIRAEVEMEAFSAASGAMTPPTLNVVVAVNDGVDAAAAADAILAAAATAAGGAGGGAGAGTGAGAVDGAGAGAGVRVSASAMSGDGTCVTRHARGADRKVRWGGGGGGGGDHGEERVVAGRWGAGAAAQEEDSAAGTAGADGAGAVGGCCGGSVSPKSIAELASMSDADVDRWQGRPTYFAFALYSLST